MKALTICQPYAHLIIRGTKRVENRTWATNYRGRLYIHAGKSREWLSSFTDELGNEWFKDGAGSVILVSRLAFGSVVAVANLVDCLKYSDIERGACDEAYPWIRAHEHASGPWCWVLESVTPIGPWPYKGALGLFNINDEALDAIANREIAKA